MAKIIILSLICAVFVTEILGASDCPLSSKVTTCSPKCIQDSECSTLGGKCCPNICNAKSCVLPNQINNSGSGYKGSTNSGTGSYCGNVKCGPFEKCDMDRTTKRMKCVRA